MTDLDEILEAARSLGHAARWSQALRLLDATADPSVAVVAAEIALDSDLFAGTDLAAARIDAVPDDSWDRRFLRLRHGYFTLLWAGFGPDGKDPQTLADLRGRGYRLSEQAPDDVRRGWTQMYLGLIADNLFAERDVAPAHYAAALGTAGDDLLTREALRHLGGHDRDDGDLDAAACRWARATELAARAGLVSGTLSQQMLLATLARERGDEAGARLLAEEIARWAAAIGAVRLLDQAEAFLAEGG